MKQPRSGCHAVVGRVAASDRLRLDGKWYSLMDQVYANGLRWHPDKTHIGNRLDAGKGFDFLGYRLEAGKRWVRKKSWKRLKDKIREPTAGPVASASWRWSWT
ncbi:MAG: hypothetical protein ACRERS_00605 [Methylococcales bacterium]